MRTISFILCGIFSLSFICIVDASPQMHRRHQANTSWPLPSDTIQRGHELQTTFEEARHLRENGESRRALSLFRKIENVHDHTWSPRALWQIAEIYEQTHQYIYAVRHLKKIFDLYPEYEHFSKVLDRLFQIAGKLKSGTRPYYFGLIPGLRDYKSAVDFYQSVVQRAPTSPLAPQALMCIAQIEESQKQPAKAIKALNQLIDQYPQSELSPEAFLYIARIYESLVISPEYDQGALREAISYYEDFTLLFPGHERYPWVLQRIDHLKTALAKAKIHMADFYYFSQNNWSAADRLYSEALAIYPSPEIIQEVDTKRQRVRQGISAPKCPVDFLFDHQEQDHQNQAWLKALQSDKFTTELSHHPNPPMHSNPAQDGSSTHSAKQNPSLLPLKERKEAEHFLPPSSNANGPSLEADWTKIQLTSGF
jgi:outer membrane protein assembly factor BamD